MAELETSLFRSYDVRGAYGTELTEEAAYIIARAYAEFSGAKRVVIAGDGRTSTPSLTRAIIAGLTESGVEVVDIGMGSTDVLYFASWHDKFDGGIMVTASHMPGKFNGLKFLRLGDDGMLAPIGKGIGMEELETIALRIAPDATYSEDLIAVSTTMDIWPSYVSFVLGHVTANAWKPLKVAMDAGNGMGGIVAERIFADTSIDMIPMYFEPDGDFPNHEANPFIEENRLDIIAKVKEVGADLGIAWDADCDRVYFIDEHGTYINGDFITALLAKYFLSKETGKGIVYDLRSSWVVPETIATYDGMAHEEKVGHSYIKVKMRETQSVFGGEVSGHYYFASNAYMDNGFIPAVIMIDLLSQTDQTLSELIASLGAYYPSGEYNFKVEDKPAAVAALKEKYEEGDINELDGLSVFFQDWHFNVRPSANDPVLRLNVDARSKEKMEEKLNELSEVIKTFVV